MVTLAHRYEQIWKFEVGCHSSVVSSVLTILRPQVQIPSTPSTLFSICVEIVMRIE